MQFKLLLASTLLATAAQAAPKPNTVQQTIAQINSLDDLSGKTNDAAKTITVVNFFETTPKVIDNLRTIINNAATDLQTTTKRALAARQDCFDLDDVSKCGSDIQAVAEDPEGLFRRRTLAPRAYSEVGQYAVCDVFNEFVESHEEMLNTIIAKHEILGLTPFQPPMHQVLRTLQNVMLEYGNAVVGVTAACAEDATASKTRLDNMLDKATETYAS